MAETLIWINSPNLKDVIGLQVVAYDCGGGSQSMISGLFSILVGSCCRISQLREIRVAKVRRWRQGLIDST
jgi:hypothetical protein